jgi:predicted membrane channel-forming protein YqfA (hemolysin III family)
MKTPKFMNLAVFVIFFGIALIEAFQKQNWLEAALFLALGVMSLWADIRKI